MQDWECYCKLRNQVTWLVKRAKLQYFEILAVGNPRKVWKEVNGILNEVLVLLKTLDVKKATGTDGISGKLLRLAAPSVSGSLTSLFNYSIGNGQIPREWKAARVTPIPKSGNSEEISNYQPVSVSGSYLKSWCTISFMCTWKSTPY